MKNKKNTIALISFIAGIIMLALCFTITDFSSELTDSVFFSIKSGNLQLCIMGSLFFVSGLIGIFVRSRFLRIALYSLTTLSAICSILADGLPHLIVWSSAALALLSLLVQILDASPEKKLFFVNKSNTVYLVFESKRPHSSEIEAVSHDSLSKSNTTNKYSKLADNKSHKKSNIKTRRPHAGKLAKSPNGKNFKYKKKRK